jgi:hypothetical protein
MKESTDQQRTIEIKLHQHTQPVAARPGETDQEGVVGISSESLNNGLVSDVRGADIWSLDNSSSVNKPSLEVKYSTHCAGTHGFTS